MYTTWVHLQAAVGWQGDLALGLTLMVSAGGGVASYIPGTEANRISRAEQGSTTGSNTTAGLASYIPGTEANRMSHAEQGSSAGSNTAAGLASYIPGTQANQDSKAAAGQDSSTHTSGNDNTGGGLLGGLMSYIPGTEANRESNAATGQDSATHNPGSGSAEGGAVGYSDQQVSSARGGESDSQQAFKPFSIDGADAETWSYYKVTSPQHWSAWHVVVLIAESHLLSDPVTQHVQ